MLFSDLISVSDCVFYVITSTAKGFAFVCINMTFEECHKNDLFGAPSSFIQSARDIDSETTTFLWLQHQTTIRAVCNERPRASVRLKGVRRSISMPGRLPTPAYNFHDEITYPFRLRLNATLQHHQGLYRHV